MVFLRPGNELVLEHSRRDPRSRPSSSTINGRALTLKAIFNRMIDNTRVSCEHAFHLLLIMQCKWMLPMPTDPHVSSFSSKSTTHQIFSYHLSFLLAPCNLDVGQPVHIHVWGRPRLTENHRTVIIHDNTKSVPGRCNSFLRRSSLRLETGRRKYEKGRFALRGAGGLRRQESQGPD